MREVKDVVWDWDPCSEQMGHWVDQWLHARRQQGATRQDCERMVRRLAWVIRRNVHHDAILQNFIAFVNQHNMK